MAPPSSSISRRHPASLSHASSSSIPTPYRLLFLTLEPLSALLGAIYAHYLQPTYLSLLAHQPIPASSIPAHTSVVLSHLANLYLVLCLNEALVLRATADLKVWRTFLFGLLVADLGHLWGCRQLGNGDGAVFWKVWEWNGIDVGNVGVVYGLAVARVCFLAGVGFGRRGQGEREGREGRDRFASEWLGEDGGTHEE